MTGRPRWLMQPCGGHAKPRGHAVHRVGYPGAVALEKLFVQRPVRTEFLGRSQDVRTVEIEIRHAERELGRGPSAAGPWDGGHARVLEQPLAEAPHLSGCPWLAGPL